MFVYVIGSECDSVLVTIMTVGRSTEEGDLLEVPVMTRTSTDTITTEEDLIQDFFDERQDVN